jgi:hypothetical protein
MLTRIDAPTRPYTRLRDTGASAKPVDIIARGRRLCGNVDQMAYRAIIEAL